MALTHSLAVERRDGRPLAILAKSLYRELRGAGYSEKDVIAIASELLGAVASEVRGTRASES